MAGDVRGIDRPPWRPALDCRRSATAENSDNETRPKWFATHGNASSEKKSFRIVYGLTRLAMSTTCVPAIKGRPCRARAVSPVSKGKGSKLANDVCFVSRVLLSLGGDFFGLGLLGPLEPFLLALQRGGLRFQLGRGAFRRLSRSRVGRRWFAIASVNSIDLSGSARFALPRAAEAGS